MVIRFKFNEIDLQQRAELKTDLNSIFDSNIHKYVLNMSKIGFFSSLVIATIISFAKNVGEEIGKIKLCELKSDAKYIVSITKLDKAFEIYDTEHDALQSLSGDK